MDVKLILEKGKQIFEDYKEHKINIIQMVQEVVKTVEEIAKEFQGTTGEQKKAIAIQAMESVIDIPFVPQGLETWIYGFLIDQIVGAFNNSGVFKHA